MAKAFYNLERHNTVHMEMPTKCYRVEISILINFIY